MNSSINKLSSNLTQISISGINASITMRPDTLADDTANPVLISITPFTVFMVAIIMEKSIPVQELDAIISTYGLKINPYR